MAPAFLLCGSVGRGLRKGQCPMSTFLPDRKLSPSCLLDMVDTPVPPCRPLVPFKLLPQCWSSEKVNLSKSVYRFFKRNCLGLLKFLPLPQSLMVFAGRSYGDLPSWHWNPGLGRLVWDWDSSLLRYPSRIFIHHMWMWDQSVPRLHPSYIVWTDMAFLYL